MSTYCDRSFPILRRRRAFTLVELLVVIAIIGVLIALLLPAIQAAREAARRTQCTNQLHNMGLAVLNYESQRKALPQALDAPDDGKKIGSVQSGGTRLSWVVRILPFIEQAGLYAQFNLKTNVSAQSNQETATDATRGPQSAQIDLLMCPSDSARNRFFQAPPILGVGTRVFGKANFAAYVAPEHIECIPLARGAMINVPQSLKRIEDGTSKTLLLGEIRTREDVLDLRGAWALAWPGASLLAVDMHGAPMLTRICAQPSPPAYVPNPTYKDYVLTPNIQRLGDDLFVCDSATTAPAARLENMPCNSPPLGETIAAARSNHPGGVDSSHIDGSYRWIGDDIDPILYGSLVCTHDGMTLTE